jgi:hypothetical protein
MRQYVLVRRLTTLFAIEVGRALPVLAVRALVQREPTIKELVPFHSEVPNYV